MEQEALEKTRRETLAARVPKKEGQAVKAELKAKCLLDDEFEITTDGESLLIPVKGPSPYFKTEMALLEFRDRKPRQFHDALKEKGASNELIEGISRAFDIIGTIAVLEPTRHLLLDEEALVAAALMEMHPNVETVCIKEGIVRTEYRVRPVKVIAGTNTTKTLHSEFDCSMWVDVAKAYFSPRYAPERWRVAQEVKTGEEVCVMFAGVGPYALLIARNMPTARVWAVEINPEAVELLKENIKLNKAEKIVVPVLGDVREELPKLGKKFDRIIMPLPKGAADFLDIAVEFLKPGGTIHFYQFLQEADFFNPAEELVKKAAERAERNAKIIHSGKCGKVAPGRFRIVVDAIID